jgi:hypothetical protein
MIGTGATWRWYALFKITILFKRFVAKVVDKVLYLITWSKLWLVDVQIPDGHALHESAHKHEEALNWLRPNEAHDVALG